MNHLEGEPASHKPGIRGLEEIEHLLATFSHTSAIGIAICDNQLRYQSVNTALAATNGISVEAHLGNTIRDVLGQAAEAVVPALTKVLATGEAMSNQFAVRLPSREGIVHCVVSYFPVKRAANRGPWLGGILVETTALKRLHQLCSRLTDGSVGMRGKERYWRIRELESSLNQYFEALTISLASVAQHVWQSDKSADEQMAPAIESLDKRILVMRTLVSAVAERFSIDSP